MVCIRFEINTTVFAATSGCFIVFGTVFTAFETVFIGEENSAKSAAIIINATGGVGGFISGNLVTVVTATTTVIRLCFILSADTLATSQIGSRLFSEESTVVGARTTEFVVIHGNTTKIFSVRFATSFGFIITNFTTLTTVEVVIKVRTETITTSFVAADSAVVITSTTVSHSVGKPCATAATFSHATVLTVLAVITTERTVVEGTSTGLSFTKGFTVFFTAGMACTTNIVASVAVRIFVHVDTVTITTLLWPTASITTIFFRNTFIVVVTFLVVGTRISTNTAEVFGVGVAV